MYQRMSNLVSLHVSVYHSFGFSQYNTVSLIWFLSMYHCTPHSVSLFNAHSDTLISVYSFGFLHQFLLIQFLSSVCVSWFLSKSVYNIIRFLSAKFPHSVFHISVIHWFHSPLCAHSVSPQCVWLIQFLSIPVCISWVLFSPIGVRHICCLRY